MSEDKYISFDAWWGGFSNIRMTYELAAAISVLTGRKLILPHRIYCLFLSRWQDKNTWFDMFDALDKDKFLENFDCVEYRDIPEYKKLESDEHYFHNVQSVAKVITFGDRDIKLGPQKAPDNKYVITFGDVEDEEDFKSFVGDRTVINLDVPDRFIHFPRNLFGHFYYHVYGKNPIIRNIIKEKVNNGIQYREEFFEKASVVKRRIGSYNAIHIRRGDFLQVRKEHSVKQTKDLLSDITNRIPRGKPLFIATDEKDKSVFSQLEKDYRLFFLDDFFKTGLKTHEALLIDQLICVNADIFLGSFLSTFSDYINIVRGQLGYKDYHREGTNFQRGLLKYERFPWQSESWSWDKIWDYHWKYEKANFNVGIFGSHNSAIAISRFGEVLEVVELERWLGIKNAAFYYQFPVENPNEVTRDIYEYFKEKYGAYLYDNCIHNSCEDNIKEFPAENYEHMPHHVAHVNNAIYQSPAKKSLNISFDGGSDEGHFNIYICENGNIKKIKQFDIDLAVSYQTVAHYLEPIRQEDNWWWGNLVYAGKVMGLSAYGTYREDLAIKFREFYKGQIVDNVNIAHERFQKIFKAQPHKRYSGQEAYDLAATNQAVFEEVFEDIILDLVKQYPYHQLQFSGGGALNVINNAKWDAFVTPNPDDRGLALGMLMSKIKPGVVVDSTYLGSEPYDNLPEHTEYSIDEFIDDIQDGKIIGLIQGRSEHGARALCNRSIIASPREGMKDILNSKVKKREYFRPFAPVCRKEDADKFFETGSYTRHMSHNVNVIDPDRKDIASIVHEDGTARLQTVTKDQNEFMYNVLTRMDERGITPVLINTSFNIMGKPILNRYADALWMRDNTGLDIVCTDNHRLL